MATVYFDIKLSEFYTEPKPLYPFDFTEVGQVTRQRLESFITSVEPFHLGTIGDVLTFNLTEENKTEIKISTAPFEIDQDDEDDTVYKIKYGYVAMIPRNVLNGLRLFRSWTYNLGQLDKLSKVFQTTDNVRAVAARADMQQVLDITYKKQYNTYAAIAEFKVKKS